MKEKTKKSFGKKIVLAVVLVVLAAGVAVAVKNYGNIKALYKGLTTSTEDLSANIEQNKQNTSDALSNAGINISKEDFDKLNDGELTAEQIAELLQGSVGRQDSTVNDGKQNEIVTDVPDTENQEQADVGSEGQTTELPVSPDVTPDITPEVKPETDNKVPDGNVQQNKPEDTQQQTRPENPVTNDTHTSTVMTEAEYNEKVAEYVAKMYVIKSEFLNILNEFETNIKNQYLALPKEQRTTATKAKIVADNMAYVTSLEAQCDARVDAVTKELYELMKANGKDTALVDAIKAAYVNEKELKKSYYISLYK